MSKLESDQSFNAYDIKRLEMYAQNLVDYHLVIDLVPEITKLYFTNKLGEDFSLSLVQAVTLFFFLNLTHINIKIKLWLHFC